MRTVRVGDLVRWISVHHDDQEEVDSEIGVVAQSGNGLESVLVLFSNGESVWLSVNGIEVISESR
jgi:hypothetical protein|tara:strand:- start:253 stop:447 length:195 start_codon:yes stop_codon:yes gene_type:complete